MILCECNTVFNQEASAVEFPYNFSHELKYATEMFLQLARVADEFKN